jgi:hypothetical protein
MTEKEKHPGGRPSKATPETMEKVLDGIKAGLSYEGACGLARISWNTFNNWKKKGETATSGKFFQFLRELEYAEAIAEAELLKRIKKDPDTKYACWLLERRHPNRWGKTDKVKQELTGKDGGTIILHFDKEDAGL